MVWVRIRQPKKVIHYNCRKFFNFLIFITNLVYIFPLTEFALTILLTNKKVVYIKYIIKYNRWQLINGGKSVKCNKKDDEVCVAIYCT